MLSLSVLLTSYLWFQTIAQVPSGDQQAILKRLDRLSGDLAELSSALADVRQDVEVIQRHSSPESPLSGSSGLDVELLEGFQPPILARIVGVELEPEFSVDEFSGGTVSLEFSPGTDLVSIRAVAAGIVVWAAPDRNPAFERRSEVIVKHENGYESYYGLISDLSPRLKDATEREGSLEGTLGLRVKSGELLGYASQASPNWVRFGLRRGPQTVNPLGVIGGFYIDPSVRTTLP